MIYFIHGFEWPYKKELTVQINECNQPDLSKAYTKNVIFPVIKDINSFNKFYFSNDTIQFDKLIYKYRIDKETVVKYGFLYNEICEDSFWENFLFTIEIILKQSPEIENIYIPISLFPEFQSGNADNLFKEIYAKLSFFPRKTFFILLEKPTEIRFIYNVNNFIRNTSIKGKNLESKIFTKDSQILSCFGKVINLHNPLVLNYDIDFGLGICDYKQFSLNLISLENNENKKDKQFPSKIVSRFEDGITQYYKKKKPTKLLKEASYSYEYKNFKTYIRNPIDNKEYKKWFLEDNYVPYKRILEAAKIMKYDSSNDNKEVEESFFNLFGYCPNYQRDAGHINYYKNTTGNLISYKEVIQLSNNTLVKKYEYDNSEGMKNHIDIQAFIEKGRKEIEGYCTIFDAWKVFNSIDKLTNSDREKISRYFTKNTKNYFINRKVLFFLVLFLNLDLQQAESFFKIYDCVLGIAHLREDMVLKYLLEYCSNSDPIKKIQIFVNSL